MHNDSSICINFPALGDWSKFVITASWTDAEGFRNRKTYRPADIPAEHLDTLQGVVESLRSMGEPWTATHVVAQLAYPEPEPPAEGEEAPAPAEEDAEPVAVELTAYVRSDLNANRRRHFTCADIPALRVDDPNAILFYKLLTDFC